MSSASDGAGKSGASAFTEHRIDAQGISIRCREAGQGRAVVVLHEAGAAAPAEFETLLAEKFRVIALECPGPGATASRDAARAVARAARSRGLERYVLMSHADAASPALWQALDDAAHVEALVLISPSALLGHGEAASGRRLHDAGLEARLGEIKAATLVLIGTNDKTLPPTTGRTYVERIPGCYYMLVYDAGEAIATDRPGALFEAVSDFVERRGMFIVERNDSAINP